MQVNLISKRILVRRTPHGKKDKVDNTNSTTKFDTATAKSGTPQGKGRSVQIEALGKTLGATVYITDMDCSGTVIRPSKKPRSCLVDTPTTVVRRNRVQLRNIPIDTNEKQDEQQTVPSLNISSRPRRIKTLSSKARENLGLE